MTADHWSPGYLDSARPPHTSDKQRRPYSFVVLCACCLAAVALGVTFFTLRTLYP